MHEGDGALETRRGAAGEPIADRLAKCPVADRPVETGGAQHGAGMADSAESTSGAGSHADCAEGNVADLCGASRVGCQQPQPPRTEGRVASVGHTTRQRRKSVHPEESEDVVIEQRPEGPISTDNVMRLLRFQQYRCALTGRSLTPELASLDHIIPIRCDGEHLIENTQVLHRDVNRSKGSLMNDEFIQLCREVVSHTAATRAHGGAE